VATLIVLQGPDKGRTWKTHDDRAIVGRGSDQVPLSDQTVSRRHAELKASSGHWTLTDLSSANGTFVNGVRVNGTVRLKHGDQIRMGGTLMVYSGDDSPEQLSGPRIPTDMVTLDAAQVPLDSAVLASVPSNDDSVILAAPETAQAVRSWKAVRDLTEVIGSMITPDQLLPRVMDILFEQLDVDRGVLFMKDDQSGDFLPEVVRFNNRKGRMDANKNSIVASRTIVDHVARSRQGVLLSDVQGDERFRSGKSVQNLTLRSVICAPIVAREQVLGVIHLDCPITRHAYNEADLRLVTAVGNQTGLAIENSRLMRAFVERERLAAAGETVSYLSHSIKNILQNLRGGADLVQRGLDKRDFAVTTQGWRILDRNLDKCYSLMLNMLAFSKSREPVLQSTQLNEICEEVVELVQGAADEARIVVLADLDPQLPEVPADRDGIHQALLNLVSNAVDAVPRGSGVVNVRSRFDPVERQVVLVVEDNGPGVPESQRSSIFEAFHSTKGHGGTGLGLPVARKIAREHAGSLTLGDSPGGGAKFEFSLPTADARPSHSGGDTQGPRG